MSDEGKFNFDDVAAMGCANITEMSKSQLDRAFSVVLDEYNKRMEKKWLIAGKILWLLDEMEKI